jgi:hypothetical protein
MNSDYPTLVATILDTFEKFFNSVASFFLPGDVDLSIWTWMILISAVGLILLILIAVIAKFKS